MNSAALPDTPPPPTESSPWDDVRRIYRRVLVLRATGQRDAADTLEHTDLARALAAARLASEDATLELTVLGEEAERVAQAQTLAELVAPLIAQRLRAELPNLNRPSAVAPASGEPAAPAPARSPTGEVPPIADLIDSMLSQQSPRGARRS